MKTFMIERILPGAGSMSTEELQDVSNTSVGVISVLGRPYTWLQSFVTDDKVYCIHQAESEEDIREHSKCSNLPITTISEIKAKIDPTTAG